MTIFSSDLTWIIFLPVVGALLVYAFPVKTARWVGLAFSALVLLITFYVFFKHALSGGFGDISSPTGLTDSYFAPWISFNAGGIPFNVSFSLGVDGLSMPLVILNALLTMLAIIGGWEKERAKEYIALLLLLEAGVMGVFMAMDLILFFLFWEVELAPMFLLIGIWGNQAMKHGVPGRIYSAWKFLLYTFFGSVFMLAGILLFYFTNVSQNGAANATAYIPYLATHFINGSISVFGITAGVQLVTFLLIFVAFAVKIPMFPLHTWLPDAHTDAPTEVSVLLAGVLLKMGAYGLIRICLTLLPQGVHQFAGWLAFFAVVNIVYGAFICLVQTDMKKLIAYSSVSHMGIVLLGVAAAASSGNMEFRMAALTGATVQMFSHGIISGLLFFCVGVIYDHAHTREIAAFGGVAKRMPMLATLFTFAALASLGLPGLAGFVAEYMVFTSSYQNLSIITLISVFTMILTAAYLLWMIKRVFFGPFNAKWSWLPDASAREMIPLYALAGIIVFVGIYPLPLIQTITPSLTQLMHAAAAFIR